MKIPEKGFYYHYKHDPGGELSNYAYEVVGISRNSEDKTYGVLYVPLYENTFLAPADYVVRPLEMFMENVEVDGVSVPRFRKITDPETIKALKDLQHHDY